MPRDDFPYGIPQLMMGFTADGQSHEPARAARDRRRGVSWRKRRADRAGIPMPAVAPGANSWESGRTVQTRIEEMTLRR